ncbi:MAG: tetratricopeptide repeat protein [Planctomycetales bacterium]|nr:tetratricopeptide repeat protein [Planctomycetales bacterium]
MTKAQHSRSTGRAIVLGLTMLPLSSGCASFSAPSWMSRGDSSAGKMAAENGMVGSLANAGKGFTGQVKTMGTAVSSAMSKAKSAVIAPFSTTANNSDPTSLANMPTNLGPEIWVTNGQLYESQGKFAKALDNYTKALEIEPTNEAALLSTARLYVREQKYSQAESFFAKALAANPQAETYNELASMQQQQGRTAEALASVNKAIEMEPASPRYRNNLAGMLVSSGRSDEAVQQLQQVFPPAVANYNVAYLHFTHQNLAGAQQHLQLALQADPNLKEARDLMEKIAGSSTAQSAVAAYQTAGQIYRTAETLVTPTVPAGAAVYQRTGANDSAQAGGYPTNGGYPMPAAYPSTN